MGRCCLRSLVMRATSIEELAILQHRRRAGVISGGEKGRAVTFEAWTSNG